MSDVDAFRPIHCPDNADGRHYIEAELGDNCHDAHGVVQRAADEASNWLKAASEALGAATLLALEVPHPQSGQPVVRRRELDPLSAHVVVELARFGSLDATYLYVGLVAQHSDSVWHGVAGIYLPLCPHCGQGESVGKVRQYLRALWMPQGTSDVTDSDLPGGLEPQDGWLEHRVVAILRLPGSEREPWRVIDVNTPALTGRRPVLVQTGAMLTAETNLLYLERPTELAPFVEVLFSGTEMHRRRLSVRRGTRSVLRRIAAENTAAPLPPRRIAIRTPRSRAPAGWSILRTAAPGSASEVLLTRTATTLLRSKLGPGHSWNDREVDVWLAPRLSPGGAVDGSQLLALMRELHRS